MDEPIFPANFPNRIAEHFVRFNPRVQLTQLDDGRFDCTVTLGKPCHVARLWMVIDELFISAVFDDAVHLAAQAGRPVYFDLVGPLTLNEKECRFQIVLEAA